MNFESTLAVHFHSLVIHRRKYRPWIMNIIDVWIILLPLCLSHDTTDTLSDVRFWRRQDNRVEGWDVETFMGLTERCKDDLLLRGLLESSLFHTTHRETGCLGKTLMKKFTVLTTVTQNEKLSRPS